MLTLAQTLILITVFALPLFPMQVSPQISYVLFLLALLLLPLLVRGFREALASWITRFFVLFLLASGVSTIFSLDRTKSLMQLGVFLSCFVVFVTGGRIFSDERSRERLALVLIGITAVMSIISLYHTLILNYVSKLGRGVSFAWVYFGHNHLSALLLFAIPFSFYFLKTFFKKRFLRAVAVLSILFFVFSLVITFARASIVSLLLASVFFLGLSKLKRTYKVLVISALAILYIVIFPTANLMPLANRFGVNKYGVNNPARLTYWRIAIANGLAHPFTGTGLDTYRIINSRVGLLPFNTDYAHNFFLQMFSDAGFLGLATSVLLISSVLWAALRTVWEKRNSREGFLFAMFFVGLLASTLNSLVDFDWQLPTVSFIFWLMLGITVGNSLGK